MKKNGIVIVVIIASLLLVGAVVWLFVSGMLSWKGQQVATTPGTKIVCDTKVVDTYNEVSQLVRRGGGTTPTVDTEGIAKVKADILSKEGYENDPTCQSILFWVAIQDGEYEAGKTAYDAVKRLHEQNIFANNNIRGNDPLFNYETSLFPLSPEAATKEGIGGSE